MYKKSQLVGIVEGAFSPLECVAELQNYDHAFGFAVYLPDGIRITSEHDNAALLCDEKVLESVVVAVRRKLQGKDIALDAWSLPKSDTLI